MVQIHSGLPFAWSYGALAQLGEHLLCKQGVIGSIPIGSTSHELRKQHDEFSRMKRKAIRSLPVAGGSAARVFDIVNGFLNRCRGAWIVSNGFGRACDRCITIKINQTIIWLR